jgi:N-acetylneuraminic acid mutarotase
VTATRLASGKVLVAGATSALDALNSSEIYDPTAKTWTLGSKMLQARSGYTSIMLATGKVLFVGGENINGVSIDDAELYNPSSGTFAATGSMTATRVEHTALLLATGKVLVSGGYKQTSNVVTPLASAELYNPATGTWSAPRRSVFAFVNASRDHCVIILHVSNAREFVARADIGLWRPVNERARSF